MWIISRLAKLSEEKGELKCCLNSNLEKDRGWVWNLFTSEASSAASALPPSASCAFASCPAPGPASCCRVSGPCWPNAVVGFQCSSDLVAQQRWALLTDCSLCSSFLWHFPLLGSFCLSSLLLGLLWSLPFLTWGLSCHLYSLLRWANLTFRLQKPFCACNCKICR